MRPRPSAATRDLQRQNAEPTEGFLMSPDPGPPKFRETARDLLFGLLALQNNFISRDVLVAAFGTWIADKSKHLDQVLLDQGHLDIDCHALLTGLVRQHLKLHGDDPEKSLEDLSAIGAV